MNNSQGKNLLFAGVGGQGVLLVSELAARAAIHAGFDAKKTELHGAAQRGGSVLSHVRFGPKVYSPLCSTGEVDILLATEKLEGLRWAHYVRDGGMIILNDEERLPAQIDAKPVEYPKDIEKFLSEGPSQYPKDIEKFLSEKGYNVFMIDATAEAKSLGNYRAANTVLLGTIVEYTGIDAEHWHAVMKENLNPKILDLNLRAFEKGRELSAKLVCRDASSF
jgi:indolepyruvate ferredoxin oxidoreductase beta subunit